MMKPLREHEDESARFAASLLDAYGALPESRAASVRVARAIDAACDRKPARAARRLRLTLAVMLLLAAATAVAATIILRRPLARSPTAPSESHPAGPPRAVAVTPVPDGVDAAAEVQAAAIPMLDGGPAGPATTEEHIAQLELTPPPTGAFGTRPIPPDSSRAVGTQRRAGSLSSPHGSGYAPSNSEPQRASASRAGARLPAPDANLNAPPPSPAPGRAFPLAAPAGSPNKLPLDDTLEGTLRDVADSILNERHRTAFASGVPSETRPLVHAVGLLQSGDPNRAAAFIDRYLAEHQDGACVEEAMVLAIWAAVRAHRDDASGRAADYLRRFPEGRWANYAERVVGRGP